MKPTARASAARHCVRADLLPGIGLDQEIMNDADRLDRDIARALVNPTRWAIFELLSGGDLLTSTDIAPAVGLSPSAVSHHARVLERHGLIERAKTEEDGRERHWRIRSQEVRVPASPAVTEGVASQTIASVKRDLNRLQRMATSPDQDPNEPPTGTQWLDVQYLEATESEARTLAVAIRRLVALVLAPDRSSSPLRRAEDEKSTYRISVMFSETEAP